MENTGAPLPVADLDRPRDAELALNPVLDILELLDVVFLPVEGGDNRLPLFIAENFDATLNAERDREALLLLLADLSEVFGLLRKLPVRLPLPLGVGSNGVIDCLDPEAEAATNPDAVP